MGGKMIILIICIWIVCGVFNWALMMGQTNYYFGKNHLHIFCFIVSLCGPLGLFTVVFNSLISEFKLEGLKWW
jgi:hypothetical protein